MSDVTVIGLGEMGSAIANAFLNADYDVTVWNRSPERMEPFRDSGVPCAKSVDDAGAASVGGETSASLDQGGDTFKGLPLGRFLVHRFRGSV